MHVNEANSKSLIQWLPSASSRLQLSFQLGRKEEKGISRAVLCILTLTVSLMSQPQTSSFLFFFSPSTCRRILRIKRLHHEFMSCSPSGPCVWFATKVFFIQTQNWWDVPGKSKDGADTKVEEEPESYWRIWETPGFYLWREDRKKPQPQNFM